MKEKTINLVSIEKHFKYYQVLFIYIINIFYVYNYI